MTLPLFDAEPVSAPVPPVQSERARLNAAALRVLAHLKQKGRAGATNVELCTPEIGGLRAIGRVDELRRDGWNITKHHVSGGVWLYRLEGYR